jgi:type IV pilus assembly protein PilV
MRRLHGSGDKWYFHFALHVTQSSRLARANKHSGFTLIEVMVTLIVLSTGLLGVAGLQLTALKNNDSAYFRSQASLYCYEIVDRMRANRGAATAGNYDHPLSAFNALTVPASTATIIEIDRYDWYQKLDSALNSAQGFIDCDTNATCTVMVQWNDTRAEKSPSTKQLVVVGQL